MKLAPLLLFGAALASANIPRQPPERPLCRVQASASQTYLPGVYTVIVTTRPACPPNGHAFVRLGAGRSYPYQEITPDRIGVYYRVPWYWRGYWRAQSGISYAFRIEGLMPPWERP